MVDLAYAEVDTKVELINPQIKFSYLQEYHLLSNLKIQTRSDKAFAVH